LLRAVGVVRGGAVEDGMVESGGWGFLLGAQMRSGGRRNEGDEAGSEKGRKSSIHGDEGEGRRSHVSSFERMFQGENLLQGYVKRLQSGFDVNAECAVS
jgi:hypothetical protein